MEKRKLIAGAVCAFLVLIGNVRADFFLYSNQQLTVSSNHTQGELHDTSSVSILSSGYVGTINSWGFSTVDVSGGAVSTVNSWDYSIVNMSSSSDMSALNVSDYSTVNLSGGSISSGNFYGHSIMNISDGYVDYAIRGYGSSTINIYGGYVHTPNPRGYSTMNMSGGSAVWFSAEDSSTTYLSGGAIDELYAVDSPTVNISGGSIENLHARDTSTSIFFGQNFQYGDGLALDGNRLLGTGVLSGEWMDGTPWSINILENESTATIQIIPEPATLALLALGAFILQRKNAQT